MIRDADIFQLLWSSNAMRSDYVRQEYEYALSLGASRLRPADLFGNTRCRRTKPPVSRRKNFAPCTSSGSQCRALGAATRFPARPESLQPAATWRPSRDGRPGRQARPCRCPRTLWSGPRNTSDNRGSGARHAALQNDPSRVFCRRCANELRPTSPRPVPAPRMRPARGAKVMRWGCLSRRAGRPRLAIALPLVLRTCCIGAPDADPLSGPAARAKQRPGRFARDCHRIRVQAGRYDRDLR